MTRIPILRIARSFSAQAQPAAKQTKQNAAIATAVLPNKVFVSAVDNGSPVTRITVAYKAGSRYEPTGEEGLVHQLRVIAGNTTTGSSTFAITRNLQQYGANLVAVSDRETISYTLEAARDQLDRTEKFLADVASRHDFRPWEIQDSMPRLKYEIAGLTPQVRALDLLHKAAFRRGLGNSLFCAPRKIGNISPESFQHFVATNFTGDRCSVSAVGISLERALAFAQSLDLKSGNAADKPSAYKGGDLRKEMGGELAHVALGFEGVSLANTKEVLAAAILSRALANGPAVKWGFDNSPLSKAIAKELSGTPFAVNGFNISYTDNGLFGVLLSAPADQAGKATQIAGKMLKSGLSSVGSDALKKGRAQLQMEILSAFNSGSNSEGLATQAVLTGALSSPTEVAENVSKITDGDISNVITKLTKSKLSVGCAGNLNNVPYSDEIQ